MSETDTGSRDPSRSGNVGVPAGCLLIVVCFFLPWVTYSGASALEVSADAGKAEAAFAGLGLREQRLLAYTRVLYLVPLLALSTLMLELTVPSGRVARRVVRLGILAGGITLCLFFIQVALHFGPRLSFGFWGSLTGALFISVGVVFDVIRNE